MTTTFIGQPVSRVDGWQKVTGGATYAAEFDVANVAQVRSLMDQTKAQFGRIDILVNNAGWTGTGPALDVTEEEYDNFLLHVEWRASDITDNSGVFIRFPALGSGTLFNSSMTPRPVSFAEAITVPSDRTTATARSF